MAATARTANSVMYRLQARCRGHPLARQRATCAACPLMNCRAANPMAATATTSRPNAVTNIGPEAASWRAKKAVIVVSSPDTKTSLLDTL